MVYQEIAKYVLPGSPDWFMPNVLATTTWHNLNDGGNVLVAFSSRPYVHIFIVKSIYSEEKNNYSWSYIGQIQPHHERTSAITFDECPSQCLVSCGFDGLVRRWKYSQSEWMLENEFNVHNVRENANPTAVSSLCISGQSYNFVGTDKGLLIIWIIDCEKDKTHYLSKKYENDYVLVCSLEKPTFEHSILKVAVGYKKASNFSQVARFYAHERDVCHLVWKPNSECENSAKLLTCGRDQMVKVWDVSTSECCFSTKVPGQLRYHANDSDKRSDQKNSVNGAPWISACYTIKKNLVVDILFSGLRGELFSWCCSDKPINATPGNQGHYMLIFSMLYVPNSPGLVITVSQDRVLIVWELTEESLPSVVLRLPTLSAGVFSLAQSSFSNSPLVAGLSDGSLLFWKVYSPNIYSGNIPDNQSKEKSFSISPRGFQSSPITALAWHPLPQYENILAYGTESGCVEIVDVNKLQKIQNQKSKPLLHAFGSTVYRVAWGPMLFAGSHHKKEQTPSENNLELDNSIVLPNISIEKDEKSNDISDTLTKFPFYVYSVSKGKIYCHFGRSCPPSEVSMKFPSLPGTTDEDWKTLVRSDIAFRYASKSNELSNDSVSGAFDCLIGIGYRSGQVDVYGLLSSKISDGLSKSTRLTVICRVVNHSKCINCLSWSRDYYWLAIASNESFITITDFRIHLINALNHEHFKPVQLSTCLARLEGHFNRVTCLDWSPHDSYLLLSSSFDGTANVWRVHPENIERDNLSVSNFRVHRLRLFTCLWSRQEPDLAFSGGELCHLFGWQPSKQIHSHPPHSRRHRPPAVKRLVNDQEKLRGCDILSNSLPSDEDSIINLKPFKEKVSNEEVLKNDHEFSGSIDKEQPLPFHCNSSRKINSAGTAEKRKRPALFPNLFQLTSNKQCELNLHHSPPFDLGTFLSQILSVSDFITERVTDEKLPIDLLILLPEVSVTRTCLLKYLKMEASNHLKLFHFGQRPNTLVHLDAYCIVLLWMGCISNIPSIISTEGHLPFWLLYAIQLAQSTFSYPKCYSNFTSSKQDSVSMVIDLVGEKIKDMQTTSPDILVSATLLVCANRIQEAVELLLSYDRVKEALVLARIRLNPSESWKYTEKCVSRLIERSSSNEKSFFFIIYNIGKKEWMNATNMVFREVEVSNLRPGKEIEKISWHWIGISFILNTSSWDYLSNECLRLSSMCLTVGFRLLPTEPLFLERWSDAFSRLLSSETTSCSGLISSLLLLDIGRFISIHMANYHHEKLNKTTTLSYENRNSNWIKYINPDCITCLNRLISDRQPSSLWEVCLTNFCVDFLLFYLVHNHTSPAKLSSDNSLTTYIDRYESSRKSCEHIKPEETTYLITNLFSTYQHILVDNHSSSDND
ncbi:gem associated protein 5 [Schistosoma japonicum]|nr:gem associated protein 5 [Schistosoma japonicum]